MICPRCYLSAGACHFDLDRFALSADMREDRSLLRKAASRARKI